MTHKEKHKQLVRNGCVKDIFTSESGYKVYDVKAGYLTAEDLRVIADYLDELNKEWDEQVSNDCKRRCEGRL